MLYFGNNWLGWQVLQWLISQGENIVGLVIHPAQKRKYGDEILKTVPLDPSLVFDGSRLQDAGVWTAIKNLRPDIGVSVMFGYILKEKLIRLFPSGCINLHPGFPPFNKGRHQNIWSIVENSPAGATVHFMDAGIDTGDIISQKKVAVDITDTGETLYRKLEQVSLQLFKETWPLIRSGQISRTPQDPSAGTYHCAKDLDRIDKIDLNKSYKARDLINILRARTFPPYEGAYFVHEGRKIFMRLQLVPEEPKSQAHHLLSERSPQTSADLP